MNRIIQSLDALNLGVGRLLSLTMLPVLMIAITVVVLRYVFGIGFVWLQDSYVWLASLFFIGLSGSALLHDCHVRVELLYARMSVRKQAFVNAMGVLCLLWPTLLVIIWGSYKPIARSWRFLETSANAGGLPFAYVHKSLIYLFCGLLFLQGLSLLLKSCHVLLARGSHHSKETQCP